MFFCLVSSSAGLDAPPESESGHQGLRPSSSSDENGFQTSTLSLHLSQEKEKSFEHAFNCEPFSKILFVFISFNDLFEYLNSA